MALDKKRKIMFQVQSISLKLKYFLIFISLIIVAFGQPARSPLLGLLAALIGYALIFRVFLEVEDWKNRFILATSWFTGVQLVQLSWMVSHPFLYILAPYFLFAFLQGLQFGLLSILVTKENVFKFLKILGIASFWVLMEWSRLFFMSGYSWNPAGLALTGNIYSLQMASFFGIYGLSFFVILVNLLVLNFWMSFQNNFKTLFKGTVLSLLILTPFIYGYVHLTLHEKKSLENNQIFKALLVQPSFQVDAIDSIYDRKELIAFVIEEWRDILKILEKKKGQVVDLIVLPEYVVPFGTYTAVYPLQVVKDVFKEMFGIESLDLLAPLDYHLAAEFKKSDKNNQNEKLVFVNNAFWLQSIANIFNAPVIAGLEDVDDLAVGVRNHFSAALYFEPALTDCKVPERYEKRVLVPLGEYIPFSFCEQLAISYGVNGSFTKGEKAKVIDHPKLPFGVSICYEETFGHVMRENRQSGAELLVNLTNDGWFPNSKLTKQHFDHARLRSVECGIPVVRACNTGITSGFDSLGRIVATLGDIDQDHERISDALIVEMPTYHYQTIYSKFGDHLILLFSFLALLGLVFRK